MKRNWLSYMCMAALFSGAASASSCRSPYTSLTCPFSCANLSEIQLQAAFPVPASLNTRDHAAQDSLIRNNAVYVTVFGP